VDLARNFNTIIMLVTGLGAGTIGGVGGDVLDRSSSVAAIEPTRLVALLDDLHTRQSTLVIDSRPFLAFNAAHILTAFNAYYPPILMRRRTAAAAGVGSTPGSGVLPLETIVNDAETCRELLAGRYTSVVVYDEGHSVIDGAELDSLGERERGGGVVSLGLNNKGSHLNLVLASLCSGLPEALHKNVQFLCGTNTFDFKFLFFIPSFFN